MPIYDETWDVEGINNYKNKFKMNAPTPYLVGEYYIACKYNKFFYF